MPTLQSITEKLGRAQKDFLSAADAVPAEQWKMSPGEGRWSAAELVCHVMTVERAVLRGADKLLQNPPQSLPFFKRFHVPMALVESRLIRRKTPLAVDARLLHEKEEMLGELREVRERTFAFIEETRGRDLSKYRQSHPFLGSLNAYEWFQFVASHEIRHTKQMREIATALPKNVASLQK